MKRVIHNGETVTMNDFRPCMKKPVTVHAMRMDTEFEVLTPEGAMHGKAGDYLMRGVRGEMYPCDAAIFMETYEFL